MARVALGIDVGESKGLDLVLMTDGLHVLETARRVAVGEAGSIIDSWKPDVVAIDSPPCFPTGGPRATEVDLRHRGLSLFATPWEPTKQSKDFYNWMREGFKTHRAARDCGFDLFNGGKSVRRRTIEVFPFASAAVLSGGGRPLSMSKRIWRRAVLTSRGVDTAPLSGIDQIDAALAAYTGILALDGCFCWRGQPREGVIILPCRPQGLLPRYARAAPPGPP